MSVVPVPVFEALLVPHRSLSRSGVIALICAIGLFSVAIGLHFGLLGAWPVTAFSLFEIPLVIVLLALNSRRARATELIMLTTDVLTVTQTGPAGRRNRVSLPAAWLRVDLEDRQGVPHVVVSTNGRRCEVGAFLHEPNKVLLFGALRDALYRGRNPRFDNPQLRDG